MPDETLLERFAAGELPRHMFTHWAMLRVMWLLLAAVEDRSRGRKAAVDAVFAGLRTLDGRNFHLTNAYFWVQLVDLALHLPAHVRANVRGPAADTLKKHADSFEPSVRPFVDFLSAHEWLANDGLVTAFYSRKLMCQTPEAMDEFRLPDLRPLPSVLSLGPLSIQN